MKIFWAEVKRGFPKDTDACGRQFAGMIFLGAGWWMARLTAGQFTAAVCFVVAANIWRDG